MKRRIQQQQRGFTLVELIITVAIVAILASLAIPNFLRYQMKTRRTEVFVNLRSIALAESGYERLYGSFVQCTASPTTSLDNQAWPFDSTQTGWDTLEWKPDGKVYCHYSVQLFTNTKGEWVRPTGLCDLDNDNKTATWYLDVDPNTTSSSSQHMVLRPATATLTGNLF